MLSFSLYPHLFFFLLLTTANTHTHMHKRYNVHLCAVLGGKQLNNCLSASFAPAPSLPKKKEEKKEETKVHNSSI